MKEGTVADIDTPAEETDAPSGGLTSSSAFPALVALWFAALFGGGCLFLPPALFDAILGDAAPFGPQTRIVFALVAAGIGLVLGLLIARQVRTDAPEPAQSVPRTRKKPRKDDPRPPLDVRAALGLGSSHYDLDDEDDDEEDQHDDRPSERAGDDDLELTEENLSHDSDPCDPASERLAAPIDDPHFASAWSDSDTYRPVRPSEDFEEEQFDEASISFQTEQTNPAPHEWAPGPASAPARPSRYNPFADMVRVDEDDAADGFDTSEAEEPQPADPFPKESLESQPTPEPAASATFSAPPPPAWPAPRAEEPTLKELGVAELVERLARALQSQQKSQDRPSQPAPDQAQRAPARTGQHRHESALAPANRAGPDVDRALRGALDRLSRLDDVA